MLFQTHKFLLFFILVYALYLAVKPSYKWRNIVLLVSSYYFYGAWNAKFLLLIIASTSFDYYLGLKIADSQNSSHRKRWLILSISTNLLLLGFFKYYNFFAESFHDLLQGLGLNVESHVLNVLLPVGISFYTFESMSYLIDVYRKKIEPCRSLLLYSVFISFFPHLVAGPIIRPAQFFKSLKSEPQIGLDDFYSGLSRCLIGVFKKLLLADTLALYWGDEMFADPGSYTPLDVLIGVYCYTFQIYLDFSSYSDIAIGLSKMLGIYLPENFNYPYLAKNLKDFWDRWHISLSTWLRDYLYISLGGNRLGPIRKYLNVFITMLLGGLWHGASWNFVIWGALHGFFISISHFKSDFLQYRLRRIRLPDWFHIVVTFHLVAFAWIFFRAETFSKATLIITKISGFFASEVRYTGPTIIPLILMVCVALHISHFVKLKELTIGYLTKAPMFVRVAAMVVAAALILICEQHFKPFIYFQF